VGHGQVRYMSQCGAWPSPRHRQLLRHVATAGSLARQGPDAFHVPGGFQHLTIPRHTQTHQNAPPARAGKPARRPYQRPGAPPY